MDVEPTNVQQLSDAVMYRAKSLRNISRTLLNVCYEELRQSRRVYVSIKVERLIKWLVYNDRVVPYPSGSWFFQLPLGQEDNAAH